jgi:uncharacterized protein (DUF302 family)
VTVVSACFRDAQDHRQHRERPQRRDGTLLAEGRVRASRQLSKRSFGVLTEIDVKMTFEKKLGREFRNYAILGSCDPQLAYAALEVDLGVGLLMPCNVCIWEDDGGVTVAAIDPAAMLQVAAADARIGDVARQARERLERNGPGSLVSALNASRESMTGEASRSPARLRLRIAVTGLPEAKRLHAAPERDARHPECLRGTLAVALCALKRDADAAGL